MLIVNQAFLSRQPTGLSGYALGLIPQLKPLKSLLLSSTHDPNFACEIVSPELSIDQGRKGHLKRLLWNQMRLPTICQNHRAHLLFTPIPEAPLYSKTRFVVTVHDLIPLRYFSKKSPLYLYFKHFVPVILTQAQHIICNSIATADDVVDFFSIPASKMTPTGLGYDESKFQFLNLPTQNYFLYVGRHDPYKNLSRLITAFREIAIATDAELWIGGPVNPKFTPALQEQVKHLGLEQCIKFISYIPLDELPILLNQAIALVFPSLWEGFGLPVLEAMACGTPVITSNVSSLPEVAQDAAILVDPHRVDQLSDAMRLVIDDVQLRANLREAGLRRSQHFSWNKTGEQTIEVLQQFL